MRLTVLLFASLQERAGSASIAVDAPSPCTVAQLREAIASQVSALAGQLDTVRVALDQRFARDDEAIADGAEVALIPPVSGG